jgi:hypothetical protein
MPEDYYPDTGEAGEGSLPPKDAEAPRTDSETALVPKSMIGDLAVGDTCTVKVVHVYADEVEVEKCESETEPKPSRPGYESELDEMATED